jgi:hypothetical protein
MGIRFIDGLISLSQAGDVLLGQHLKGQEVLVKVFQTPTEVEYLE